MHYSKLEHLQTIGHLAGTTVPVFQKGFESTEAHLQSLCQASLKCRERQRGDACRRLINVFFWVTFCDFSQSGDHTWEDLAKFGYKLDMKVHFLIFLLFLVNCMNHV